MLIVQVCKAFNDSKIQYAVVGGYAVALHGAVRGTVDLDLVLALKEESFVKAEKALDKLGLTSRLPVDAKQVFHFRKEYIQNKNLIAWSFYDSLHPENQLDIIITEDVRKMSCDKMVIRGVKVPVASLKSLIEMKKRSARPQDLEDVKALEKIAYEKK